MAFCLLPDSKFSDDEFFFSETEEINESEEVVLIKKVLSYVCKKNLKKYPLVRNEEDILNLSNNNGFLSKNQKISLRQRKIEKKLLKKLIEI